MFHVSCHGGHELGGIDPMFVADVVFKLRSTGFVQWKDHIRWDSLG